MFAPLFVSVLIGVPCIAAPEKSTPEPRPAVTAVADDYGQQGLSVLYKEKKHAALLYLGTEHSHDPEHEEMAAIEKFVATFQPTLIVVEGGYWPLEANKTEAIRRHGEFGFARFLAAKNNIRWKSFEPPLDEETAQVLAQHAATDAKLYYALRMVPQWVQQETATTIEQKMAAFLSAEKSLVNFGKNFPADTRPLTVDELVELCAVKLPELRDWRKIGTTYNEIGKKANSFYAVKKTTTAIRNQAIEKEMVAAIEKGERVMVLAGGGHFGMITPVLAWLKSIE